VLKFFPKVLAPSARNAPVKNRRSRYPNVCSAYPPAMIDSIVCSEPVIVAAPVTVAEPGGSPVPLADVSRTSRRAYWAPRDVFVVIDENGVKLAEPLRSPV